MKHLKVLLAAVFTTVIVDCASAQSNFFAGAGVGVNTSCSKEISMFSEFSFENNLGVDVFAGSWLNSSVGLRGGYRGISTNVGYGEDYYSKAFKSGEKINYNFFHGDIMWDVISTFSGDKGRIYSIVPYVGAGVEVLKAKTQDIKTSICGGIYNSFRINKSLCVYVDLSAAVTENPVHLKKRADDKFVVNKSTSMLARPMYIPSFFVGLAYAPGKKGGRNGSGYGSGRSRNVDSCWGLPAPRMPKK